ncbi:hypothetical protein D3C76_1833480 [compost metagenome]
MNAFVEAFDRDPALFVVQGSQQRHEGMQRVRNAAAKRPGVQIGIGGKDRDLHRT